MDQSTEPLNNNGFDKTNAMIAALTAILAFVIYRMTVAPTLSYWDCGEFIACAHILGNPHPPGSPLFVILGRFFDLIYPGDDPAFRINMFSVVSSAFATMFGYLILSRMIFSWYRGGDSEKIGRIIAYGGGFIGAMFMAFSQTNWNNSVEAEVYGLSMLMTLAIFWLGLKWFDHRYSPTGQRITLMVPFIALLGIGAHMTVFLVVPVVAIFFSIKKEATKLDWMLVAGFFVFEMLMIVILSSLVDSGAYNIFMIMTISLFVGLAIFLRNKIYWPILLAFVAMSAVMVGFKPFMFAVAAWLVISGVLWLYTRDALWRLSFLMIFVGMIGFSIHAYIPIRSSNHPVIDENTPSRSFKTFVDFLDRKQYGSMSMTERMFNRRGAWSNQFGDHARMGYWRFFKGQYSSSTFFPILLAIGILGLIMMMMRNTEWGFIFLVFFLIGSAGLVLYMNFADGTHYNKLTGDAYQEVRDRDYFFTPAYMLFGLAIGLGFGAIVDFIRRGLKSRGSSISNLGVYVALAVFVLTPLIPVQANYFTNDRSTNRMAYNYAYNLLNSCDKDAILFTSGDNDTFPIWCVQEVYNMRRDVRVVNFSLLNTDWYIWQMKHADSLSILNLGYDIDSLARVADSVYYAENQTNYESPDQIPDSQSSVNFRSYLDRLAANDALPEHVLKRVPMSMTDNQILWTDTTIGDQTIARPAEFFIDRVRGRRALLVPSLFENKTLKVSSMMLEDIIITNNWKYPIYFSSASGEVRNSPLKLTDWSIREGMVLRMVPDTVKMSYDIAKSDHLFFDVYKYDGISDTLIAQNENASGISLAYPEKFLDYHAFIMRSGDTAKADSMLDLIAEKIPSYWRIRLIQQERAMEQGDTTKADAILDDLLAYSHGFANKNPDNVFFYQFLGMAYYSIADTAMVNRYTREAEAFLTKADEEPGKGDEYRAEAQRLLEKATHFTGEQTEDFLLKAWELNHDKEHTMRSLLTLYYGQIRAMQADMQPDAIFKIANKMEKIASEYLEYHDQNPMARDGLGMVREARRWLASAQRGRPAIPSQPVQIVPPGGQPTTPPAGSTGSN